MTKRYKNIFADLSRKLFHSLFESISYTDVLDGTKEKDLIFRRHIRWRINNLTFEFYRVCRDIVEKVTVESFYHL